MSDPAVTAGQPEPLGVTADAEGVNVAVFSAHAEAIEFCLFDDADNETRRITLPARSGDVFHGHIAGVAPGARYGLRAHGPWRPEEGHRFNPHKLLVDPYAAGLDRPFRLEAALFDQRARGAAEDEIDSAAVVPKAIVQSSESAMPTGRQAFDWGDQVIYELHVRGFTRRHPGIPEALRGTFKALTEPAAIEHLVRLGISTVELMPSMAWIDERHLPPLGLANYWGYNPVVFGAPDVRLAPGGFAEVRAAIARLHEAGIAAVLDVVLNHSGESDAFGPTISLRGLDNATYYRHAANDPGLLINDAGTGNTLALERAPVTRLAMDCLRRWARTGLDGFRFDLAATLGRRSDGFDPNAPFLVAMQQDPELRELALIAEPWDIGPGGYQVGNFPALWGEWNDHYRDTARRFWRGDAGMLGEMATRLAGSADVFARRHRPLSRGINFVTAHDGFSLADLVSYAGKHNEANGEHNQDGTDDNKSWNHGVEGPSDDPAIRALRQGDARALLAMLIVSRGTPMLTMGDECGRTQSGNNNAYAQDNELTWLDWSHFDGDLADFTATLVKLRRGHPALRQEAPLSGQPIDASAMPDVEWRALGGGAVDWGNAQERALAAVFYAPASAGAPADRVLVALNGGTLKSVVVPPAPRDGFVWRVGADSAVALPLPDGERSAAQQPGEGENGSPTAAPPHPTPVASTSPQWGEVKEVSFPIQPRSVLILVEEAAPQGGRRATDPALLERLAAAAGIAPEWWDVSGNHYPVADDTKRALLAALQLPAGTGTEARESLARLSEEEFGRDLPFALVVREGTAGRLRLGGAAARERRRLALRILTEEGGEQALVIGPEDGERDELERPDGRMAHVRTITLPPLPRGWHRIVLGETSCRLTIAPAACHLPEPALRRFGLTAHLYTLRRGGGGQGVGDQGIGDFTALGLLAEEAAQQGAATIGLNPLHAQFPGEPEGASPYHPSDRRFLDPIYIDVEVLAGEPSVNAALSAQAFRFKALAARSHVDYTGVRAAKGAVLEAAFAAFERAGDAEFDRFTREGGASLQRFGLFEAIAAAHPGMAWQDWPVELRRPDAAGVKAFAGAHAGAVRFALWQQWVADRQFGAAAERARAAGLALGFYRDLAVGTAPNGAAAWADPDMLMAGVSVGAPPDPLGPEGQNWNLPPPDPFAMRRDGYDGFGELVAANMRHAGALRIDHVMGLRRLFLIPEGASGAEGTYLAFPFDDLAGQVALESTRARCLVVGEDLGTVPAGMREQLADERMLSYRVLWFERTDGGFTPPEDYPDLAVACVSTHDLPTLAGWWEGTDIEERLALGFEDAAAASVARERREEEKAQLISALVEQGLLEARPSLESALPQEVLVAVHRFVARTESMLALTQLDDLAGEIVAVNLPGTDRERPNWRRRIALSVEEVLASDSATPAMTAMRAERPA
jgi:glycogen debranching enzyme GlgX/4-alpha-glucanotransferase